MDRLRRLAKSKSSAKNDQGDQHVRQEKSKSKLPSSSLVARSMGCDDLKFWQPIYRQNNSIVEHILPRSPPPVALQGDAHFLHGESHNKRFTEQPESEDKFRKPGSSRDAFLELLEKPNSLFVKHLQGLQGSSSRTLCSHLPIPEQSNPQIYQARDQNVERNIGGEEKEGTYKGTSKIVILKPNYAMSRDVRNSLSSHDPSSSRVNISGSRKSKGHRSDRTEDEDFVETIDFIDGVEVSTSRVREAKKIAKKVITELSETTRTTKETECREAARRFNGELQKVFSRMRIDFPSYVKEIPGTGGLHDFSKIDSASESEVIKMTSYDSTDSFMIRQAKKRLLERWRRAQRCEHARTSGKGSTLGEMLCIPEDKLKNLDATNTRRDRPLGISSADGWKDMHLNIKTRSRSLPPATRDDNLNAEREFHTDDKLLMSKEARHRSKSDRLHMNFTEKGDFSSKTSSSSKRKTQSGRIGASDSYVLLKKHISRDDKAMVPPIPTVSSTIGTEASTSRSMLKRCDSSCGAQEHSNPKHLSAEAESSGSSNEADPSPISDLKVSSREDVLSGPECFKQLRADLRDLRKQLSLLRKELKSTYDAPMHIKTHFAGEGSSLALHADKIVVSECWESCYIADVLIECGLYDTYTTAFMPSLNGPNHRPLGSWVFHNLEKKYCDEISAPKYERMLLFDRIRLAVKEISQSCMNLCPWVKPVAAEYSLIWQKCELRNELHELLAIQDAEVKERISGKVIEKVTNWGDLRNSVDVIGIKIERSLTDDLLMELLKELQLDVPGNN